MAVPVAVNFVAETNVVVSAVLPNMICAFLTNLLPFAVMVNEPRGIAVGETVVSTGTGFSRSMAALPLRFASLLLVAVICTESEVGRAGGALYRPVASMVPTVEFPPATPFTDQRIVETGLSATAAAIVLPLRGATCETGSATDVENPRPGLVDGGLATGTVAVNCCVAPARTLAVEGVILIPELPPSIQLDMKDAANRRTQQRREV